MDKVDWRVAATLDRLISNIPAACEVLRERGYISLAGQLERDRDNLVYWQTRGGLKEVSEENVPPRVNGGLE